MPNLFRKISDYDGLAEELEEVKARLAEVNKELEETREELRKTIGQLEHSQERVKEERRRRADEEARRGAVEKQLGSMQEEVGSLRISPAEVELFYQAHRDRYQEPQESGAPRQKKLEEVRSQVERELREERLQQAQQELLEKLLAAENARIFSEYFLPLNREAPAPAGSSGGS